MTEKTKYLYENKEIGDVLAQGFAKICQQKPQFPISYLARFLKNYTINNQQKTTLIDKLEHNKFITQKLSKQQKEQQAKQLAKASALQKTQQQKTKFLKMISAQQQPETVLNKFCQWVCVRLGFGAVYMGELEYQERKIDLMNEDGEEGHLEMEKDKIVKFKYSSIKQANVIVGKLLTLQSVVGKLLTQVPQPQGQQQPPQDQQQPLDPQPLQPQSPSTYLPSVVDNQQLKFFTYPKLGAYFATTMTIKSYLHQKLIDDNLSKVETFRKLLGEYEKEMEEKEGKFREMYEERVGAGVEEKELEALEEEFEKEKQGVVKPVQEPFTYIERKFIICADTLGQDRQIPSQQRKQLLSYITHLKTSWQHRQHQQLMSDIQRQLTLSSNPSTQQHHQPQSSNHQQQLTLLFQQQQKQIHSHEEVQKVKDNQKLMELELNTLRIERTKQYLLEERYVRYWEHLLGLNVIKYQQVVKQFLIVLGFKKEQFCFLGSNVLDWRKTKTLFNSLKETINEKIRVLTPRGSKPEQIMTYAKCSRVAKNLENLQVLTLANYNVYLALILRLLQLYVKTRLLDKEARVQKIAVQRQLRQQKVKQAEDKANEKKEKLDVLKAELQQKGELEAFDEQVWNTQYDEENPLIEIPDEVQDEFDLDLGEGQQKNEAT